jgi:hypothetical protein
VRIADTLSLAELEISEALWSATGPDAKLSALGEPRELQFDGEGNLTSDPD